MVKKFIFLFFLFPVLVHSEKNESHIFFENNKEVEVTSVNDVKKASDSGNISAKYTLSRIYHSQGKIKQSLDLLKEIVRSRAFDVVQSRMSVAFHKHKYEIFAYARAHSSLGRFFLKNSDVAHKRIGFEYLEKAISLMGNPEDRLFLAIQYLQGKKEDLVDKAIRHLNQASIRNKKALHVLGNLYLRGQGVPQDLNKARGFFEQVYASRDSGVFNERIMGKVTYVLGVFELLGLGGEPKNEKRALELLKISGKEVYNAEALFLLSWMYRNGFSVEQDFFEAGDYSKDAAIALKKPEESLEEQLSKIKTVEEVPSVREILNPQKKELNAIFTILINEKRELVDMETLKKEADSGNLSAVLSLAKTFLKGIRVSPDVHKSAQLYSQVIKKTEEKISQPRYRALYAEAKYRLGGLYLTGNGIEQNVKQGESYLQAALSLGNAESGIYLMEHYKSLKNTSEINKVVEKLEEAAQNSLKDQFILAKTYLDGKFIPVDFVKARGLLEKIISDKKESHLIGKYKSIAYYHLAVFELLGLGAESKNEKRALELLRRSQVTNNPQAFFLLSWMYYHGVGGKQDKIKSQAFLNQIKKTHKIRVYEDEIERVQNPEDLSIINRLVPLVKPSQSLASDSCKRNFL